MADRKIALVVGTSGVTGTAQAEELLAAGWTVHGVSRRPPLLACGDHPRFFHVAVDLTDPGATHAAIGRLGDITHVFHCGNDASPATRIAMTGNMLDAVEAAAPDFSNISLLQGTKYYGSYLGPFKTPAKESDPRIEAGDFYYGEEDAVLARQAGKAWTWTAVRPTMVCGYAAGNPVNLATALAIYGAIQAELGHPFGFPSTPACFEALHQAIDAGLLARSAIHVATTPGCGNQAYNVGNGDIFRWKHMWPALAGFFGLAPAGPTGQSLKQFLSDKGPVWAEMTGRYGLIDFPFGRTPDWAQGAFSPPNSRLACEYDFITDLTKIRQAGYCEVIDTQEMFLAMFARFREMRLIP